MDTNVAIGAGLTVLGSQEILTKMLGPTADYLGGELKNLVEKCNINLDKVFIKAKEKLGSRLNEPGQVNARVLKNVIEEGMFCEDEIVAEYLGGVLASSRSADGRDDRGIKLISYIKNLSSYQLRLHFLCYYLLYSLSEKHSDSLPGDIFLSCEEEMNRLSIFIPLDVYGEFMNLSEYDKKYNIDVIRHSVEGLMREGLVGKKNAVDCFVSPDSQKSTGKVIPSHGITLEPTPLGTELFVYGQGIRVNTSIGIIKCKGETLIKVKNPPVPIIEGSTFFDSLQDITESR